jgi:hypothetical protein
VAKILGTEVPYSELFSGVNSIMRFISRSFVIDAVLKTASNPCGALLDVISQEYDSMVPEQLFFARISIRLKILAR